ncbi:MAG: hypothetical protein WA610_06645 [Thermodesulfovibrionales bacterium]
MMRTRADGNIVSLFYKPLCVLLMLGGLFSLIWLRSSIVSMTYSLRDLEERTMEARKDMKILLAERSNLMSVSKVTASLNEPSRHAVSAAGPIENSYVMPDRTRVVMVQKNRTAEPQKASLRMGDNR